MNKIDQITIEELDIIAEARCPRWNVNVCWRVDQQIDFTVHALMWGATSCSHLCASRMESRRSGRDDVEIYESFEAADWVANIVTFANKIQQETDVGFAEVCLCLQDIHQAKRSNPWLHRGPCCIAKAIFWNPAIFQCKSLARLQWSSLQRRIRLRTFCTVQVICWSLQQNQENDCKIDLGQAFIFSDNSRTSVFEFTSLCWDSRGHRSFIAKLSHWAPFNSSNDAWPQVQGCSGVGNVRGPCLFWKKQRTQLTQYT